MLGALVCARLLVAFGKLETGTPSHPWRSEGGEGVAACHQASYTAEVEHFACEHCNPCGGMKAWRRQGVPLPVAVLGAVAKTLLHGPDWLKPCGFCHLLCGVAHAALRCVGRQQG